MRVVFIGSVLFSKNLLEHIIDLGANVVGVVTKKESKFNADFCDLSTIEESKHADFYHCSDINNSDAVLWIKEKKPDIIFCFGWSQLLCPQILSIPSKGVVGYHPAALPRNRGRHPIIWALALGLEKTASTFLFLDNGADTGDILSQVEVDICRDDDACSLYQKIVVAAKKQVSAFLGELVSGSFKRITQENHNANSWRKRSKIDGLIDWRMSSESIYNLVRALTRPYVGAHFNFEDNEVKVWKAEVLHTDVANNIEPGKVLESSDGVICVKCGTGAIRLLEFDNINVNSGAYL